MPLLQVLFPAMIGEGLPGDETRGVVWKITTALTLATLGGIASVLLFSPWLCGGRWGVRLCEPRVMSVLLVSILPLSLLRMAVLLQFARGRDWLPLWLAVPTLAYVFAVYSRDSTVDGMAMTFAEFAVVCFIFFMSMHLAAAARAKHHARV
jgi:hypothetical protein